MKVVPSESDWELAKSVHRAFSNKPGAQHIASEFALAYLSATVSLVKPESVLEFGAGIGTITYLLLKHEANIGHITSTEHNRFCLQQIAANIPGEYSRRFDLITDERAPIPRERRYDLVIIDNLVSRPGYGFLELGSTCFVEGRRSANRREIECELANRGLRCDLVNYNPGMRPFSVALRHSKIAGIPYPKFRFFKVPKGCWIGNVEPGTSSFGTTKI